MPSLDVQDQSWNDDDASIRMSADRMTAAASLAALDPYVPCARWTDGKATVNWPCAFAALVFSSALLFALVTANVISVHVLKRDPTVVKLLEIPPEPPMAPPPPEAEVVPIEEVKPVVVAPKPIIQTPPIAASMVQTVATPPPAAVAVVAPPAEKPAPAGPVSITDLSTSLRSGKAPPYPFESKKKREEGTVVVTLVVATNGRVSSASVQRSSGFTRLDKAAVDAVRKFVYEPYIVNGQPVAVRTTVTFPFKLRD